MRMRPDSCCWSKARIHPPAITHVGLDQDFVTGDLKGSSSMTVLFLRSSGDGFAGEGKSLYSEAACSYNPASMTGMRVSPTYGWLHPILLISSPALPTDDKYSEPKSPCSFTPELGENSEFLPLPHSPKVDGWSQKGNVPPREWRSAKNAQTPKPFLRDLSYHTRWEQDHVLQGLSCLRLECFPIGNGKGHLQGNVKALLILDGSLGGRVLRSNPSP